MVTLNDIRRPAFAKILVAEDPSEIYGLWAEFLDDINDVGFQEFVRMYQEYYDTYLR